MKVLLIEDNKDIADMVRLCLESENIVCEATDDGKAGLQYIKEDIVSTYKGISAIMST